MTRIAFACLALASLFATAPASAITNENGDVLITQAAVLAGSITPGDTAGFPVTISQPGTYRLTTNLTVTTAVNGIEVRANEVTIEMGGHTMTGGQIGRNGITSFNRSLTVQNGTVRGFTLDGVRTVASYLVVDRMRVLANGRTGVFEDDGNVNGYDTALTVTNSTISQNAADGVYCGGTCLVQGNQITQNIGRGIVSYGYAGVFANVIVANGGGIFGSGGVGSNTLIANGQTLDGTWIHMQPNACNPACPPPTP